MGAGYAKAHQKANLKPNCFRILDAVEPARNYAGCCGKKSEFYWSRNDNFAAMSGQRGKMEMVDG
jgi:hypothetical protein